MATSLSRSPWVIHYDASSCNGCDIEILACLTPGFDAERLGVINTGNPKHADIFLVTGSVNEQNKEVIQNIYHQMPDPKAVVAVGVCALSGGIFAECYNVSGGVDKIIPVDVVVPGCAARPESIIDGIIAAVGVLEEKQRTRRSMMAGLESLIIERTLPEDLQAILELQKMAYRSEAEIYGDFHLAPLTQTLDELKIDFLDMIFLKAVMGGQLVGSIRTFRDNHCGYINRLVIHPLFQNVGIGSRLMGAAESVYPDAERYEVFTHHKSKRNLFFLTRKGYGIYKTVRLPDGRDRLFMQKIRSQTR